MYVCVKPGSQKSNVIPIILYVKTAVSFAVPKFIVHSFWKVNNKHFTTITNAHYTSKLGDPQLALSVDLFLNNAHLFPSQTASA